MLFNKENEKFSLILNDCINGNLFDFQTSINELNKKQLFNFIMYLKDSEVEDHIYKQISRALNKDFR